MIRQVFVIGGPTASGKSSLALDLARQRSGTIINADSMQIYRGLALLTAQPIVEEQLEIPHRLYNVLAPDDSCSAARWRDMALVEINKTLDEGRLPIVVGGTGFYINTLLQGLSPIPDVPAEKRAEAVALQKEMGNPAFHAALAKRDPETAAKLDPYNTQRVVRAWEVLAATGVGLAAWQSQPRVAPPMHFTFTTITLIPPRALLHQNCDLRFQKMLERGAEKEARDFRAEKAAKNIATSPLDKALGYPDLCAYMDGHITKEEMISSASAATRQYAKRQTTWFRNQMRPDIRIDRPDAALIGP